MNEASDPTAADDEQLLEELLTNPGRIDPSPRRVQTPYGEQDTNGVDLSLIRANLRLSPRQRLRRMDRAAREAEELRRHARRIG